MLLRELHLSESQDPSDLPALDKRVAQLRAELVQNELHASQQARAHRRQMLALEEGIVDQQALLRTVMECDRAEHAAVVCCLRAELARAEETRDA